jgi:hypothetical protein
MNQPRSLGGPETFMQSMQQRRKNAIRLYEKAIKSWEEILDVVLARANRPGNTESAKRAESKIANLKKLVAFTTAKLQYES